MNKLEELIKLEAEEVERRQQLRVELDNLELRLVSIRMRPATLQKAKDLKEGGSYNRAIDYVWLNTMWIDRSEAKRIVEEL